MPRGLRVAATGLLAGALLAVVAPVIFLAANEWIDRSRLPDRANDPPFRLVVWSALTNRDVLPVWIAVTVAGAVNGGIGALAGLRGNRRARPVVVVPLLFGLLPLSSWVRDPADSKTWGLELLVVVFVGLFVWVAGRVGQELGTWQRPPEPDGAPATAA